MTVARVELCTINIRLISLILYSKVWTFDKPRMWTVGALHN